MTHAASAATSWSRHRFPLTLGTAALLHVTLFLVDAPDCEQDPKPLATFLEVDVTPWHPSPPASAKVPARPETKGGAAEGSRTKGLSVVPSVAPQALPSAESDLPLELGPAGETAEASEGTEGQVQDVRLSLSARDLIEMGSWRSPKTKPRQNQSVGLLREGLDAIDAEKGLSRSSVEVSACYRAADRGPNVGTAVLEVRADARGVVTAVDVVGRQTNLLWVAVAEDLLQRLKQARVNVPPGASGMVTRLRVDRGYLAEALSERGRTKRGIAIGQDHHPKDFGWDESTQGALRPGRISPSLGISSDSLRTAIKTKVTLLSQVVL